MNPLQAIPTRTRTILYVLYAVVGPVLIWTNSRGWTGEAEYTLYIGIGTAFGLTAASNAADASTVAVTAPATIEVSADEHDAEPGE